MLKTLFTEKAQTIGRPGRYGLGLIGGSFAKGAFRE